MDLIGLLQRPEGKTLEFKRDLSSPEKVLHTLIAFANTAGDFARDHSTANSRMRQIQHRRVVLQGEVVLVLGCVDGLDR